MKLNLAIEPHQKSPEYKDICTVFYVSWYTAADPISVNITRPDPASNYDSANEKKHHFSLNFFYM